MKKCVLAGPAMADYAVQWSAVIREAVLVEKLSG